MCSKFSFWLIFFATIVLINLATNAPTYAEEQSQTQDENWFWYLSSGLSDPNYDGPISGQIEYQRAQGHTNNGAGHFDLPGLYRRVGPGSLLGVVFNVMLEYLARDWRDLRSYSVNIYNPHLSFMHFFSSTPGRGFFARADGGPTYLTEIYESGLTHGKIHSQGWGTQIGLGYGFKFSETVDFLFHANYFHFQADAHFARGASIYVGFLL